MDDVIDSDMEAREFSLRTAYYLAHASNSAYDEGGDWLEQLGLDDETEEFTCGQFHGFVGHLDQVTVLAFRGTDNFENYLADASAQLVSRPAYPGRVHLGFAEAVEQVWPEVRRLLGPPSQALPLWVTGHSLGARWPRSLQCAWPTRGTRFGPCTASGPPDRAIGSSRRRTI
jgi:hypothetical protein